MHAVRDNPNLLMSHGSKLSHFPTDERFYVTGPKDRDDMVRDHICGAEFDEKESSIVFDFQGLVYHFCSSDCRDKFAALAGIDFLIEPPSKLGKSD